MNKLVPALGCLVTLYRCMKITLIIREENLDRGAIEDRYIERQTGTQVDRQTKKIYPEKQTDKRESRKGKTMLERGGVETGVHAWSGGPGVYGLLVLRVSLILGLCSEQGVYIYRYQFKDEADCQ